MHRNFLFDLDQTLLDFHAAEHRAVELVMKAYGLQYSEEIYGEFADYNKSLWLEFEKGSISRTELFRMRFEHLFKICGAGSSHPDPLEVNHEFVVTMSRNGVVMDGAPQFLERLKTNIKDSRIFIVTNGVTVNATGRIKSTGIDRFIDRVFISEELGAEKPSEEFFDICLKMIGEPKESCIVIGDSLSSDMQGAKNASLRSVWFMPEGMNEDEIRKAVRTYDIDHCASSFDELYEILRKWAQNIDVGIGEKEIL